MNRICVLYYHRVGPFRAGHPKKLTVTPGNFAAQMYFLKRHQIPVVSLDQAVGKRIGKSSVVLTFDDGLEDVYTYAVPVLESLKFPSTFYIVSGHIGETDVWNRATGMPPEKTMTWKQLKGLVHKGFTVGSHSVTHSVLTGLVPADIHYEIVRSKETLEHGLKIAIEHFSYPKGMCTPEIADQVRNADYRSAVATRSGSPDDPYALQRIPISATDSLFAFTSKIMKSWSGYYRKKR